MFGRLLSTLTLAVVLAGSAAALQDQPHAPKSAPLTILQINDVYETGPTGELGGLARVATLKRKLLQDGNTPFVVLGGDFLSSSVASTIFKGRQMIDAFNAMGLDLATLGNHEFDFGKDILLQRMAESKFQYVVANVVDDTTGKAVGGAAPYLIRTFGTLKVGFFGLCLTGDEVSADKQRGFKFLDPFDAAAGAVGALRRENVQAIVAVTHLPYEKDRELARRFPDITVIAGGHEHYPITSMVDRTLISKAGSDAKWVARIDLWREGSSIERRIELVPVDKQLADDPATAAVVAGYESRLSRELENVVGSTDVPLDGESQHLRGGETNLGNLVADAIRADVDADIALVNAGGIRGDRVFPRGPLSRRALLTIQPFGNVVCKVVAPGSVLKRALESGTSLWPTPAGRFPQVSGLNFSIDPTAPAGSRVRDIRVGGQALAGDRSYSIALPDYVLNGGDGYDMFAGLRVLVSAEAGNLVVTALEKYVAARKDLAPAIEGRITVVR